MARSEENRTNIPEEEHYKERRKDAKRKDKKKDKDHKKKQDKKRKRRDDSEAGSSKMRKAKRQRAEKGEAEAVHPLRRTIPETLSSADYYRRSIEFRIWLKMHKNVHFESLSRDKASKYFNSFITRWNKAELEDMYYDGIPAHLQQSGHKTLHKWGFTEKMTPEEQYQLERLGNRVTSVTSTGASGKPEPPRPLASSTAQPVRNGVGRDVPGIEQQSQLAREQGKEERRVADRGRREKEKVALEEQMPRASGREAMIEARKAKSASIHGGARDREDARDGLSVSETTLMGSGDDGFQQRLARQKQRTQSRVDNRERRVEEFRQKEEETMRKFMADMGLKPGDKITIPKRS